MLGLRLLELLPDIQVTSMMPSLSLILGIKQNRRGSIRYLREEHTAPQRITRGYTTLSITPPATAAINNVSPAVMDDFKLTAASF